MRAYRLCRVAYPALDGEGARLYGGRWNAPGRVVIYTSATLALAALEYLVHVDPGDVPADLTALTIDVPDDVVGAAVAVAALPGGWERMPAPPPCRCIGDAWLREGVSLALPVPSALVPEELNVLLDPGHPAAHRLRVVAERPFSFDRRLLV